MAATVRGFWYGPTTKDENGLTHTLIYKVDSTTALTPTDVLALEGIPSLYSLHPDDQASKLRSISPEMMEDPCHWQVNCQYRFINTSFTLGGDDDDPCNLPAEIEVGDEEMERPLLKAYRASQFGSVNQFGKPKVAITNSIGDPFDPPYAGPLHLTRITITKNYRELDLSLFKRLQGTMNATDMTVAGYKIDAFEGKLKYTYSSQWDNDGKVYFRVQINIMINPETWKTELVNFSKNKLVAGKKYAITYKDRGDNSSPSWLQKTPVPDPVLINVDGTVNMGSSSDIDAPTVSYYTLWAEDWKPLELPAEAEDRRDN